MIDRAQRDYLAGDYQAAQRTLEALTKPASEALALLALCQARQALSDCPLGVQVDGPGLRAALAVSLPHAGLEADRIFVLGWLHWLAGEWEPAEALFARALEQHRTNKVSATLAEAAYWLARVRLLLSRIEAVAEFEKTLRTLGGSPRATCWYVDLIWRGGLPERAEQVWKTVRGNPRVRACDEAPLLEARLLLRRGEAVQAERLLNEASPRGGVVQAERCLLLAWALATQNQQERAASWLQRAETLPYPPRALRTWRELLTACDLAHSIPEPQPKGPVEPSAAVAAWLRWQQARPGTPLVPWMLHQASRALGQENVVEALAWVQRALLHDPELSGVGEQAILVRVALPELTRLAKARMLADVVGFDPGQSAVPPGLLADMLDLLDTTPEGQALFAAAARGDLHTARRSLAVLAGREDLSPQLAHHLALVYHRAALFFEEQAKASPADACWRLAWHCWLRLLVTLPCGSRLNILEWLIGLHRRYVNDLLARNQVDQARRHWGCVHGLAGLVRDEPFARELDELAARFREELATQYLLTTREAMRHGNIPEGWSADYEKGLGYLRRLLSLDRGNVRLLTALVEICTEWFLDCYNNEDGQQLWEQVERFTPFALQLVRLTEKRHDLAARAALAEFYKFRGFVTWDRAGKVTFYREALRFNPANSNVRALLADLGEDIEQS